ncbi:MAG: molybdopterin synthase sulfur carrier subunit [Gammaproteobacteria bacterium]
MRVSLNGALRSGANGAASIEIEAGSIRELLTRLEDRFPEMSDHLERGIAVAIDGVVFRDDWSQKIPQGAEVVLIPRIEGG